MRKFQSNINTITTNKHRVMDIKGVVVSFTDKSGVSKAGKEFNKAELVIKNNDGYDDAEVHYCFTLFGKAMSDYTKSPGDKVIIYFNIESREFNGRWYTDLKAFKVKSSLENMEKHLNELQSKAGEQAGDDIPF